MIIAKTFVTTKGDWNMNDSRREDAKGIQPCFDSNSLFSSTTSEISPRPFLPRLCLFLEILKVLRQKINTQSALLDSNWHNVIPAIHFQAPFYDGFTAFAERLHESS
jgi:hypothetical protein